MIETEFPQILARGEAGRPNSTESNLDADFE